MVFDVVFDGIRQEKLELEKNLREDEREEHVAVPNLSDGAKVSRDEQLRGVDRTDADPLRLLHPESDGKRHEAHLAVALDRFEVVHDGNAETSDGVKHGEHHDIQREFAEHRLTRPPRQGDVRRTQSVVTPPTLLLELERGRGVDVRDPRSEEREQSDDGKIVLAPLVQSPRRGPSAKEKNVDLNLDVKLGDGAGGDRAVGLVDGVDLSILPVVDGLGVASR